MTETQTRILERDRYKREKERMKERETERELTIKCNN